MPVFKIARRMKTFLNLGAGTVRNGKPDSGQALVLKGRLKKARARIAQQEREIARLQERLSIGFSIEKSQEASRRGSQAKAPDTSTPVFFVVGQGKSGTGWLKDMLNSHPEILCKGEGRFFGRSKRREGLIDVAVDNEGVQRRIPPPTSLYNAIAESEHLRLWVERSVWTRKSDPEEHLNNLTRLAIDYFLTSELSQTEKRLVGDKTPFYGPEDVREIATVYPEAKVIHIVRDGRDQAVSRMHHKWNKSTDRGGITGLMPEETRKREAFYQNRQAFLDSGEGIFTEERLRGLAEHWQNNVSGAIRYGQELLGDNYTQVKYEDLLERPEEEAKRLLEFLGTDTSETVVKWCVESNSFEARAGRKPGDENYTLGYGKQRKGIAGDWKNVFTERDKDIFKNEAGELLVELGYEKDHDW